MTHASFIVYECIKKKVQQKQTNKKSLPDVSRWFILENLLSPLHISFLNPYIKLPQTLLVEIT